MSTPASPIDHPLPVIAEHIVATPGVCGGRPRIAGHRITVQDIVLWHERGGRSADEIAARYGLKLSEVYAALAYYHDHQDEIRARIETDEKFADDLRSRTSSRVQAKLGPRDGQDDPLPS